MELAIAAAFGVAIGVAVGMVGGGGSVLAVPVLVFVFGEGVEEATTASLVIVTLAALAGAAGQSQHGHVCLRHAAAFSVGAVPAVVLGTALGDLLSGAVVLSAFALVMLAAAAATWRRGVREGARGGAAEAEGASSACPPVQLALAAAAGAAVGVLTGLFGVGGGFLVVPILAVALRFPLRSAIGTSLAIIAATSVLGLIAHLAAGRGVDLPVTLAMAATCAAAAYAGAHAGRRVPRAALARGFAGLTATVAVAVVVATALGAAPVS